MNNKVKMQEYDATSLLAKFHDVAATILIDQVLSVFLYLIFYQTRFYLLSCF